MRIFKKLIRDKMPEIMAQEGKALDVRVLDDAEFKEALRRKMIEEVSELKDAKNDDEAKDKIAYFYEIADSLANAHGYSKEELLAIQKKAHDESIKKHIYFFIYIAYNICRISLQLFGRNCSERNQVLLFPKQRSDSNAMPAEG